MAFGAHVQSNQALLSGGIPQTLAYTSNVTAGNILVCEIRIFDAHSTVDVTDTRLNTYAVLSRTDTSFKCYMFYVLDNASSGANTVAIVVDTGGVARVTLAEYEGGPGSTLEASSTALGDSTALDSGNLVTTTPTTLIIGCGYHFSGGNTMTPGTSFTERQENSGRMALEDRLVTSASTYTATMTASESNEWGMIGAAFASAAAGGHPAMRRLGGIGYGPRRAMRGVY